MCGARPHWAHPNRHTERATRQNFRALIAQIGYQADDASLHLMRATVIGAALIHLQQNSEASEQIARAVIKKAFEQLVSNATPLEITT